LAISWNQAIFVGHCAVEGLATAGGIQGCPADALLDILQYRGIRHVFKWVDDIVIFRTPCHSSSSRDIPYPYEFDLASIFRITDLVGIPWHPIEKKGQDFCFSVKYVGFLWDLEHRKVSLPEKKCIKLLSKLDSFISMASSAVSQWDCHSLHGSLQHVTFIFWEGQSTLPRLSSFISKFRNEFALRHAPNAVFECIL